jgi:hypothetical protein
MTKKRLLSVLAGAAMLLLTTIVVGARDLRDGARDIDRMRYDVRAEQVYEGTVGSKGHIVDGLMYFALRTSGRSVEVQIGTEEFVDRSGLKFKIGETVTVIGMPLFWNGRNIVLAREVSKMSSVLVVRDREGNPMWDMIRPLDMDPDSVSPKPICSHRSLIEAILAADYTDYAN